MAASLIPSYRTHLGDAHKESARAGKDTSALQVQNSGVQGIQVKGLNGSNTKAQREYPRRIKKKFDYENKKHTISMVVVT